MQHTIQSEPIKLSDRLKASLGEEWFAFLGNEFTKPYMHELMREVHKRRTEGTVYPPKGEVFNAYKLTPYSNVKVCILGQDPYINAFEAHGLAFSTFNGQYTPSLRQIEKSIRRDLHLDENYKWDNNLTRWAKQGVFLLNSTLTVDAGKSNSHKGIGWENFTSATISVLDRKGIIFALWGKDAQVFEQYIRNSVVLKCEHPVAGSYQGRLWNNNDCFNEINRLLNDKIKW